ncbi:MAG: hypothetical protein RL323_509, partial [Pseudomonadota bacterium]
MTANANTNENSKNGPSPDSMSDEDFDALDQILDDLRTRLEEVPQWEFCEGFMAALICCRRPVPQDEYLG